MQKLYHKKYGWLTIKEQRYSPVGNRIVTIAVDSKGIEHELDGTEISEEEYLAEEEMLKREQEKTKKNQKFDENLREVFSHMKLVKGAKGDAGKDGYTPKAGIDYYTKDQVDSIIKTAQDRTLKGTIQSLIEDIKPIKGKDYFDGKDGYTPEYGKDYFTKSDVERFMTEVSQRVQRKIKNGIDGKDGKQGKSVEFKWEGTKLYIKKDGESWGEGKELKGMDGLNGGGGGIHKIQDATDVSYSSPTEGQALVWSTTLKKWVPGEAVGGGAVESVNGQTGVVVLDYEDVGGAPALGEDDNYVTDAEKTKIENSITGSTSTDNAIARYDGETGKILQNSGVTIDDNGKVSVENSIELADTTDLTTGVIYKESASFLHNFKGTGTTDGNNLFLGKSAGNFTLGRVSFNYEATNNLGIGANALSSLTTGYGNTAIGSNALNKNNTGDSNQAIGQGALTNNTSGDRNTAIGKGSLQANTFGSGNTALGTGSLTSNTSGEDNISIGYLNTRFNTTGNRNVSSGNNALEGNTTGSNNIAIGTQAGRYRGTGTDLLQTPENSIYIGYQSRGKDNDDDNSIVIGAGALGIGANTTVIGNTSTTLTKIFGGLVGKELSSDPADPAEGEHVLWQSDGTGSGDDGDVMIKITAGGTTKTATLIDFSVL